MTFAEQVKAAKGVHARNMVPKCDSIDELEELLAVETRKLVADAVKSRLRKLRADELRRAEEGVRPEPEEGEDPPPVERSIPAEDTKTCPKCGFVGPIEKFGYRRMKRARADGTEVITKRVQSYCKPCRGKSSKKKDEGEPKPTTKKAKKKGKAA